ncbi:MAG: 8-oxo-dGTP diphosphatase MutT [Candidatus Saccharimonadaceae bacterium]|nr:8-oxo-dGTP diphosphatase MutT [Candidatus Saccharimonadaceae bacterium]
MSKPVLKVTAAIIYNSNKFLICQRPKEKACGLLWEFPGGKIEPGETPEDCISRECMEELGIELENIRYFCDTEYEYPDKIINLVFFKTTIKDPEQLVAKEHNDTVWVDSSKLDKYVFCPTDTKMLEQFRNCL